MSKKTITLAHSGKEYTNSLGDKATADFREIDACQTFLAEMQDEGDPDAEVSTKRVYRTSELGETLLARFKSTSAEEDAQKFADMMNENYERLGFYTAVVR